MLPVLVAHKQNPITPGIYKMISPAITASEILSTVRFVIFFSLTSGFRAIKAAIKAPSRYPGRKPPVGPSHTAIPLVPPE